jgi:hypothetical protein
MAGIGLILRGDRCVLTDAQRLADHPDRNPPLKPNV